jgi:hypothetical protein
MEDIAPSLKLLLNVKRAVARGQSIRTGIENFLMQEPSSKFEWQFREVYNRFQQNKIINHDKKMSHLQAALTETLLLGLIGESISTHLDLLEVELVYSCENEINEALALLPLKSLLPLLGLIFPSMLMLLIEPLIKMLQF